MRDRILDRDLLVTRQKLQLKIDSMLPHNIMDHQHPLRYYDDDHQNYTLHLQFQNLAMQPRMHTWAYTFLGGRAAVAEQTKVLLSILKGHGSGSNPVSALIFVIMTIIIQITPTIFSSKT